ncbi:Arylsulfatase precursor [Thalassoglobus neptunius]|uniref:Arylsulfatase n=1 Tax=Thalassoglobus neptunius TaxID=1938619 RepID=A0A5C5X5G2_9PLAN|nr:Arylsulfatase precursor [Thalassoglobus neptunius]
MKSLTLQLLILTLSLPTICLAESSPNVILIFADDLGYGDVNCFAEQCPFATPHLDQMAREGAMLTNFYVPTPYCAPSRATILTGRYPFRHTVVNNPAPDAGLNNFGLPQSEVTIAEMLQAKGYATACYGKWHLGHQEEWLPRTQGFDEYYGILYSNDMFPVQLVEQEEVVEYPVVQATLTQRYTDRAINFITQHQEEPFFLYLPHAMPHKPLAVSDDYYTPETPNDLYGDVIAELDSDVGRLLDTLKKLSLDERTLVIFTSDNGPWYGGCTGGLRGMKGKTWEGGLKVPFIARMPGVIPGQVRNSSIAGTIDLLPTIAALTGAEVPADRTIDGRNILPMLQDSDAPSPHDAIYGMQGQRLATIRSGDWKLHVRNPGPLRFHNLSEKELEEYIDPRGPDGVILLAPFEQARPTEHPGLTTGDAPTEMMLFDLSRDPGEQINVAAKHPQIVKDLLAKFEAVEQEFPEFEKPANDYLFAIPPGKPRPLMRLIGGELRYDRIPKSQEKYLKKAISK